MPSKYFKKRGKSFKKKTSRSKKKFNKYKFKSTKKIVKFRNSMNYMPEKSLVKLPYSDVYSM